MNNPSPPGRIAFLLILAITRLAAAELVRVDDAGVVRWKSDDSEVALFGANYCLPSSSDYRAAGYLNLDRKKLIEQDMAHFARMGWDGIRLALWGDWENCDREGNLIANDHLDLMDYVIFQARQRGIHMLFTPIHRHSALWPDGKDSDEIKGFSKFYPASELGRNPQAIAAQKNYLSQILNHVNPYTGIALKDEPAIVFIELINEPHHHPADAPGSIAYINALVEAVRGTGCAKILFHNLSQDFPMAPIIAASKAQGYTIGWYPTALVAGRALEGNYLRWADSYAPMLRADMPALPRIVYEFDSADMASGYMYPAMVRAFRECGAQFAAMFAYDMIGTAPYNLGWQTHFLNLVYSPRKAVSAIIAAEAMRRLPRGVNYGNYPRNRRFGPFRVSYEEDTSELVTREEYFHANRTETPVPDLGALRRVVGLGCSPLVSYEGTGCYFLDRLAAGLWRLEVYPDVAMVQDPFAQRLNYQTVSARLIWRTRPMKLSLPGLGTGFSVDPLNPGNDHRARAEDGQFAVRPGVYLLHRGDDFEQTVAAMPDKVGRVGLREFVCPPAQETPIQVTARIQSAHVRTRPLLVEVDVVTETAPKAVTLHFRPHGARDFQSHPMKPAGAFGYAATLPETPEPADRLEMYATVETAQGTERFPRNPEFWSWRLVGATEPLRIFDPEGDGSRLFALRVPGAGGPYHRQLPVTGDDPAAVRLVAGSAAHPAALNRTVSLPLKTRISDRGDAVRAAKSVQVVARGNTKHVQVTLLETDGTAWTCPVPLESSWKTIRLPLADFRLGEGLKLPMGYPGNWNTRLSPAEGRGQPGDQPRPERIEHVQISVPHSPAREDGREVAADIAAIDLLWE